MTETFDVEFARFLARSGGVGLGRLIEQAVPGNARGRTCRRSTPPAALVGAATPSASRQSRPTRPDRPSSAAGDDRLSLPSSLAAVSSPFGWRADPLGAGRRFHAGVDLQAAYGREVPTAAAGRVVFAGEQGAYGQTVVVEHAGGLRTRYAHLSSITVEAGQELAKGQVLGRVGQSRTGHWAAPALRGPEGRAEAGST